MNTILIIIAIFIVFNFGRIYYQNSQAPTLGVTDGQLSAIDKKPNNVSSQTDVPEKHVAPLAMKSTATATMQALVAASAQYGNASIIEQTDHYLYVVFTTALMKYRDDVEFYIDEANKEVHFRSASRAGYSDMGLNRERYNKIAELYQAL
ncbi:DUF1499 domain-containing protein [Reinekea sp.]|jgi:uncharacterized protein (DUF1499 family)|uniref:DUF1499 domain-containing protein n=1 Tax=Reinekea sp. TaxID=1970455 RepID=UPI00398924D8